MRVYRDPDHAGLSRGSVVTVGNFDGLHRGHQALIERCRQAAGAGAEVALVTFEPLPRELFQGDAAPARLLGPAHKLALLAAAGVDLVWMMRFNERLAALPAPDFVEGVLVRGLAARRVVLGEDFRFGHRRAGDVGLMRRLGEQHGFAVEEVAARTVGGERVSSTGVRAALAAGDLERAAAWLGRPYSLCGRVQRGQGLGRRLGYPTANVRPPRGRPALTGVFAVRARLERSAWRDGVASLGRRPAVGGGEPLLEVHLFDFDGDLYGRRLETRFIARLRDERDFDGLDALTAQMREDEREARSRLARANRT